ncbi:MAG: hypothetical protein JW924_03210 [Fusobacteriaceae bacterium]|nr:hypothetical protein [Fusobacteriaceae bacterium]
MVGSCVIHLSENWHTANDIANKFNLTWNFELQGLILLGYADEIVDYETTTHTGKPIKRKRIEDYILTWRK